MHDLKAIREEPDFYDRSWARRKLPPQSPAILKLDEERRNTQTELQALQQQRNEKSKEIGKIKAAKGDAEAIMAEVAALKARMTELEAKEAQIAAELNKEISSLPNILADDVPDGSDESQNREVRKVGEPARRNDTRDHVEIGAALGMMDFDAAAKMSGARFVVLSSGLARLERALAQLMLDTHTQEHGYTEVSPPLLVRDHVMYGTAQLPKFFEDQFIASSIGERDKLLSTAIASLDEEYVRIKKERPVKPSEVLRDVIDNAPAREDFWLIPTAEVPLTNMVADTILNADALPLRYTAFTPCFRSEAGAAGKDTRGMIRQHQFYKVELVSITHPDKSKEEHERMAACAENILKKLGLAYRTVVLCSGDTGFGARKTYDLEVWLPGQNKYREISSCSNCGDFQARRMKARYRKGEKETDFVHTLNGSGVAVGRALIAVMENYYDASDGSIIIPDALLPYMSGLKKIERPQVPDLKRVSS